MIRRLIVEEVQKIISANKNINVVQALARVISGDNAYWEYYKHLSPEAKEALTQSVKRATQEATAQR